MPASSRSLANLEHLLVFVYEKKDAHVIPLSHPMVMSIVKQLLYTCVASDCSHEEKERLFKEAKGLAKRWRPAGVKGETRVSLDSLLDSAWMPLLCRAPGDPQIEPIVKALVAHVAHANIHPSLLNILNDRFSVDSTDGVILDSFFSICVPAIRALIVTLVKCGVDALRATLARLSNKLAHNDSTKSAQSGKNKKRKRHDTADEEEEEEGEPASASAPVVDEVVSPSD